MIDVTGLVAFVAFVALGWSAIPLDMWLERRRQRRRWQAHPKTARR